MYLNLNELVLLDDDNPVEVPLNKNEIEISNEEFDAFMKDVEALEKQTRENLSR